MDWRFKEPTEPSGFVGICPCCTQAVHERDAEDVDEYIAKAQRTLAAERERATLLSSQLGASREITEREAKRAERWHAAAKETMEDLAAERERGERLKAANEQIADECDRLDGVAFNLAAERDAALERAKRWEQSCERKARYIKTLQSEHAAANERADELESERNQLENNITDEEEDLRWLRDELQERLELPNADDDALLASVSALRANTAEAVTVLKSRDDLDGWPGIVEAALVILEMKDEVKP
jgi:chromosome segregation ATPase